MQVILLLSEAATGHPDGSFSTLRAGINRIVSSNVPIPLLCALVIRIEAQPAESGEHKLEVRLMNEDGKEVAPRFQRQFQVPAGGGATNLIIRMQSTLPKYGTYSFYVNVDGVLHQYLNLKTEGPPPTTKKEYNN